jgi:catechol 2,3-dioxygenase-like lactoylglutathione lyase family enzyme
MKMDKPNAGITFCVTHDLETTAGFYERVLGLPLVLDQGRCRIYGVAGRSYLGFCERDTEFSTEGIILTLVTDDVDAWFESLSDRDVEIEEKPRYNPEYGIYHFFLRDPNGYRLEVQRFEDPRWPE